MLGDQYLIALLDLDNATDLEKVKCILESTRNNFVETKDIEARLKKSFNIENEKEVRSLLYKLEERAIITSEKRKTDGNYYSTWFYIYEDTLSHEARLMKGAIDVELEKVEKVKVRFTEHEYMFFCERRCSPKLYSYDQMYELDGKCAVCKEGLLRMLPEEAKAQSIKAFVFNLKPFVDKHEVMIDLFTSIFPENEEFLETAMAELFAHSVKVSQCSSIDLPPPLSIHDALSLMASIDEEPFDDTLVMIVKPVQEQPPVEKIPILTVTDVLSMSDEDLIRECFRRWIIATEHVYDHLLDLSSQRVSRLRSFNMKKFFFCDSMGKKYLTLALVGHPDKSIMARFRSIFAAFQNAGYFKIQSYHPKFISKGVFRFMDLCRAGEVYRFDEFRDDIEEALIAFTSVNKCSKVLSGKEAKPPTIRSEDVDKMGIRVYAKDDGGNAALDAPGLMNAAPITSATMPQQNMDDAKAGINTINFSR